MPAAPELARARGGVRQVKINHQVKAQEQGRPARDIRIAGKIAIDLEGEGNGAQHYYRPGKA